MSLIKKLFCFSSDDSSAIGLCKFNDDVFKTDNIKNQSKKRQQKEANLSQMLRRKVDA